jgi:hypothetical protein
MDYKAFLTTQYSGFYGNVGNIILAFLFNLMGNALQLRAAATAISTDLANQFYTDIAQQYGKMLRLVIMFSADQITADSLTSSENSFAKFEHANYALRHFLKDVSNGEVDYDYQLVNTVAGWIDRHPRVQDKGGLVTILEKEVQKLITSFTGKDASALLENFDPKSFIATFDASTDILKLLTGIGNGVINVLPSGSFIKFCRDNVTSAYTGYTSLVSNWGTSTTLVLTNYAKLLNGFGEATFNCFYSVTDPTNAADNPSGINYIGWNILYNLGYMYTDVKKSIDIFSSTTS